MTTIQMITNDQVLIGVQKPKVAAGDVNSVRLHVDFDEAWDGFVSRSACFHTAKDASIHEVLLADGKCFIPASVLAEEGILFIGVRGVSADDESIKTSTLVKYKVVAGATASEKTIYPELDMYQQYLAAINNEVAPIIESYAKTLIETATQQYENMQSLMSGDVLWENEDTSVEFPAQTIALDLTEYKRIKIIATGVTGTSEHEISIKGNEYHLCAYAASHRPVTVTDLGITFGEGKVEGISHVYNGNHIPVKIIGFKY